MVSNISLPPLLHFILQTTAREKKKQPKFVADVFKYKQDKYMYYFSKYQKILLLVTDFNHWILTLSWNILKAWTYWTFNMISWEKVFCSEDISIHLLSKIMLSTADVFKLFSKKRSFTTNHTAHRNTGNAVLDTKHTEYAVREALFNTSNVR